MYWKQFAVIALVIGILGSFAYMVWADCHDTEDCEDLVNHLYSGDKWIEDEGNTVDFYTNPNNDANHPSFVQCVKAAAARWTSVRYKGITIAFKLRHKGGTTRKTYKEDGYNVVGWKDKGSYYPPASVRTWYHGNTARIREQDMLFNEYFDWDQHGATNSNEFCYFEIATHEFGHFVRLLDLWPAYECPSYSRYTMYYGGGPNQHDKITLECEDKWGLWYTYHGGP